MLIIKILMILMLKTDWYRTKLDIAKQFSPNGEIGK